MNVDGTEDLYLDLYDSLLRDSEFAAGTPGLRYAFDSATWAVSLLSSVFTIIGTGFLSSFGESLANSSKDFLKRAVGRGEKSSHEFNILILGELRHINVELNIVRRDSSLPEGLQGAVELELIAAGLDSVRAQKIIRSIVTALSEDGEG